MAASAWIGAIETTPTTRAAPLDAPHAIVQERRESAFWAAWWTEMPRLKPWVPPDAAGIVDGYRAHSEALGAADHAARAGKGDRVYSYPVDREIMQRARTHGALRTRGEHVDFARAPAAFAAMGLTEDATPGEVKAAYRALLLKVHPDHGGSAQAFRELREHADIAEGVAHARQRAKRREGERGAATRAHVVAIARRVRDALERLVAARGGPTDLRGYCHVGAQGLASALREAGLVPELAYGVAFGGTHTWVVLREPALIVDITATQFGAQHPAVKLARADARQYRALHTGERVEDAVRSVQKTGDLPDFGPRWWADEGEFVLKGGPR